MTKEQRLERLRKAKEVETRVLEASLAAQQEDALVEHLVGLNDAHVLVYWGHLVSKGWNPKESVKELEGLRVMHSLDRLCVFSIANMFRESKRTSERIAYRKAVEALDEHVSAKAKAEALKAQKEREKALQEEEHNKALAKIWVGIILMVILCAMFTLAVPPIHF